MDTTIIRDAKLEDAKRILEIYAYYVEHTAISFEYDVPTLSEFQNRMKNTMKQCRISCPPGILKSRRIP